ncbi:putative membrane protein [Methanobacterium sp. MB1]|jgi:predicted PurR-regulated permease PerM|uniref:hypothetical protein n=1 Tax=Methanobacterium sp. TaxID=2164 RepID=UPI0003C9D459|nr:hypothetical protein [uncultured Methanobacterium sp.]CDG65209.1 putative membrane protein [Methanobacterium sp. MB1]
MLNRSRLSRIFSYENSLITPFLLTVIPFLIWGLQELLNWVKPCNEIKADWGAQRVKGLSIKKAIAHSIKSKFSRDSSVSQKEVETSLIGQFMYPKLGPGQLWEEVAQIIKNNGGEIHHLHTVVD